MQLTGNTRAFIESEVVSSFILKNLHDGLMPASMYRDVGDFGDGDTLLIKTIGSATLQEVEENMPMVYNPIDTGEVSLQINQYQGDAWFITDKLRQDGNSIEALLAARAQEATRAIQESVETDFFKVANEAQTNANANLVNGFAHRITASGVGNVIATADLISMKLAFDKAQVPYAGRVGFLDPICAATLDGLVSIQSDVTSFAQNILENGFDRDHEFLYNLYGWNLMTSNRLDRGNFSDGTTAVADGVANVFMCVLDDQTKPLMMAWRQMPRSESERNKDFQRDEFLVTARWGIGAQRVDTLGILITDATTV
jgi:hypothetical protein